MRVTFRSTAHYARIRGLPRSCAKWILLNRTREAGAENMSGPQQLPQRGVDIAVDHERLERPSGQAHEAMEPEAAASHLPIDLGKQRSRRIFAKDSASEQPAAAG